MDLVTHLQVQSMERNRVHDEVDATFTVFDDEIGNKYLQIDTYGTRPTGDSGPRLVKWCNLGYRVFGINCALGTVNKPVVSSFSSG